MIDPATGLFEIVEIKEKKADYIANILEMTWLTRYPWPTEVVFDRGAEFKAEVRELIVNEYGRVPKMITTRNPQANAMVERAHKTLHTMIDVLELRSAHDLDPDFGWDGHLTALRFAMNATVHTTTRATPGQLAFGRDLLLNVGFEADWQYIKERKQKRIRQNNKRENATRIPYTYRVGDKVSIRQSKDDRKHGHEWHSGPYTITRVNDNGTVRLSHAAPNGAGAVLQTWNIRNLDPYTA